MKTKSTLLFVFLTTCVLAQRKPDVLIAKFSPQYLLAYTAKGGIEYFFKPASQSAVLRFSGTRLRERVNYSFNELHLIKGGGAELQYRLYVKPLTPFSPGKKLFAGIFLMAFGEFTRHNELYKSQSIITDPNTGNPTVVNYNMKQLFNRKVFGSVIGMQFRFAKKLSAEWLLGFQQISVDTKSTGSRNQFFNICDCGTSEKDGFLRHMLEFNGPAIKGEINVGYSF